MINKSGRSLCISLNASAPGSVALSTTAGRTAGQSSLPLRCIHCIEEQPFPRNSCTASDCTPIHSASNRNPYSTKHFHATIVHQSHHDIPSPWGPLRLGPQQRRPVFCRPLHFGSRSSQDSCIASCGSQPRTQRVVCGVRYGSAGSSSFELMI